MPSTSTMSLNSSGWTAKSALIASRMPMRFSHHLVRDGQHALAALGGTRVGVVQERCLLRFEGLVEDGDRRRVAGQIGYGHGYSSMTGLSPAM